VRRHQPHPDRFPSPDSIADVARWTEPRPHGRGPVGTTPDAAPALDALSGHELAALLLHPAPHGEADGLLRVLDLAWAAMTHWGLDRPGAASLAEILWRLTPDDRRAFGQHFDANRAAAVASEPNAKPHRRLAALRLLEDGAAHDLQLHAAGHRLCLSRRAWSLVQLTAQRHPQHAADALVLFTGIDRPAAVAIADACIASSRPAEVAP